MEDFKIEKYQSVKIGNQTWMAENLDVSVFRNGDFIYEAKSKLEWENAGNEMKPAWCYYDNDETNGEKYGKLYNWYAVNDPRGLAPEGWHIPQKDEFEELSLFVNEDGNALKAIGEGKGENTGTNLSGFSAKFGGYRYSGRDFVFLGYSTFFWSSTKYYTLGAYYLNLFYNNNVIDIFANGKDYGYSVRCIMD